MLPDGAIEQIDITELMEQTLFAPEATEAKKSAKLSHDKNQSDESLADRLAAFLRRFVFLKEESIYLLAALWIVGTYLYETFDFFGYLFLYSPEPASGKSRFLDVLDLLVHNSSGIQVSPTEAILFRTGKETQLLDEVDTWADREVQLRAVLNAGFKNSGFVTRMEKSSDGGLVRKKHKVYCPRALAGIGPKILAPATRTRTFMVGMEKRVRAEAGEVFRASRAERAASPLRDEIRDWVGKSHDRIAELYDPCKFDYLDKLSERTMDIAAPLAAILEAMFEGNERLEKARDTLVEALRITRGEVAAQDDDSRIVKALVELTRSQKGLVVANATELAAMCELQANDQYAIGQVLQRHGFAQKSIRKDGGQPLKRYELEKGRLEELAARYLQEADLQGPEPRQDSGDKG